MSQAEYIDQKVSQALSSINHTIEEFVHRYFDEYENRIPASIVAVEKYTAPIGPIHIRNHRFLEDQYVENLLRHTLLESDSKEPRRANDWIDYVLYPAIEGSVHELYTFLMMQPEPFCVIFMDTSIEISEHEKDFNEKLHTSIHKIFKSSFVDILCSDSFRKQIALHIRRVAGHEMGFKQYHEDFLTTRAEPILKKCLCELSTQQRKICVANLTLTIMAKTDIPKPNPIQKLLENKSIYKAEVMPFDINMIELQLKLIKELSHVFANGEAFETVSKVYSSKERGRKIGEIEVMIKRIDSVENDSTTRLELTVSIANRESGQTYSKMLLQGEKQQILDYIGTGFGIIQTDFNRARLRFLSECKLLALLVDMEYIT